MHVPDALPYALQVLLKIGRELRVQAALMAHFRCLNAGINIRALPMAPHGSRVTQPYRLHMRLS